MAYKAAYLTVPLPIFRLVAVPTYWTLATCSSFGPSEAHDVDLFTFVGEVINIAPVLPESHALIVVSATIMGTDTMWIADVEATDLLLDTEIDDLSGGFVSQITDTAFCSAGHSVLGALQLSPSMGMLLAT